MTMTRNEYKRERESEPAQDHSSEGRPSRADLLDEVHRACDKYLMPLGLGDVQLAPFRLEMTKILRRAYGATTNDSVTSAINRKAENAVSFTAHGETVRVVNSADLNAIERLINKVKASSLQKKLVCALCGCAAKLAENGNYRHAADEPWEDGSGFCDKYGYPIPVCEKDAEYVSVDVVRNCTNWLKKHAIEQPSGDLLVPATETAGKALADSLVELLYGSK